MNKIIEDWENQKYVLNIEVQPSGETLKVARTRKEVDEYLIKKEQAGYQNNSVYNLDRSIDIRMVRNKNSKVSTITGCAVPFPKLSMSKTALHDGLIPSGAGPYYRPIILDDAPTEYRGDKVRGIVHHDPPVSLNDHDYSYLPNCRIGVPEPQVDEEALKNMLHSMPLVPVDSYKEKYNKLLTAYEELLEVATMYASRNIHVDPLAFKRQWGKRIENETEPILNDRDRITRAIINHGLSEKHHVPGHLDSEAYKDVLDSIPGIDVARPVPVPPGYIKELKEKKLKEKNKGL